MLHNILQRWTYLSGYKYTIEVAKSKANGNCDALSRLHVAEKIAVFKHEFSNVNFIQISETMMDFAMVAKATAQDKILKKIVSYVQNGWMKIKDLTEIEVKYHNKRSELSIESGCIFWEDRLIILESMIAHMLKELHATHLGIVKMK